MHVGVNVLGSLTTTALQHNAASLAWPVYKRELGQVTAVQVAPVALKSVTVSKRPSPKLLVEHAPEVWPMLNALYEALQVASLQSWPCWV
jgi:hypothetical protein